MFVFFVGVLRFVLTAQINDGDTSVAAMAIPIMLGVLALQVSGRRVWVREGAGEGCTHVMHDRSCMTVDPRIPTMPGRSKSSFRRTR